LEVDLGAPEIGGAVCDPFAVWRKGTMIGISRTRYDWEWLIVAADGDSHDRVGVVVED
jgi:hypothetical protein